MTPQPGLPPSFGDGRIREEISALWEPWMPQADQILEDDARVAMVQTALAQRCKKSRTRGRPGTPAEVILRRWLLKPMRDWSFEETEREVRAHLVYREFTRIGAGAVPDHKSISRFSRQIGPEVVEQLHQRVVSMAGENNVVPGRQLRLDTTVVETNMHYPTDSTLLHEGVRVLTRVMKKVTQVAGAVVTSLRDRTGSVQRRILEIARASRDKSQKGQQKRTAAYRKLLDRSRRVVGQAKQFSAELVHQRPAVLRRARPAWDEMIPRVQPVMRPTRQRVLRGHTRAEGKLVSLFEPETEVIRKGQASKPTEFGKWVKIQEAEDQIVTHYEVYDQRPSDAELWTPSIEKHIQQFGHAPRLAAADTGFFSAANEAQAQPLGVKWVAVPSQSTKSAPRKQTQKKRWFKKAPAWRTGCEGRIRVLKRRHGLHRSRYKGTNGRRRLVGLGVIADHLHHLGTALAKRPQ